MQPSSDSTRSAGGARPVILAVGGMDPSGQAGILRDQLAIEECGGRAVCAAASLTAQGPGGVRGVFPVSADVLEAQLFSVLQDHSVRAVKVGLVPSPELIRVLSEVLGRFPSSIPVVVDPVVWATDGTLLLGGDEESWKREITALGTVLCPNLPELAYLSGQAVSDADTAVAAARHLLAGAPGGRAVIVKGGHGSNPAYVQDVLVRGDHPAEVVQVPRRLGAGLRGTGCRHASALATALARDLGLMEAVRFAQSYVAWSLARNL